MPAILVHYTFALSAIPEEDIPFRDVVNLGSQGPDTFMAYGTVPWKKREEVKKIRQWGHTMHALPVESVYLKMMEYADSSPHKDMLYAYIDGILMHYSVDRICHRYIFYRSGFDENGKLVGYWSWSHGFFEAVLDKTLAKKKGTYQKMSRCIEADKGQVSEISKMWAYASPAHLDDGAFLRSQEDFVSAEKMLYNPHGFRRPIFKLIGKYAAPYSQCHPFFMKKFALLDVLNEKKEEWIDPCTGEKRNESFEEMLQIALEDFKLVHQMVLRAKQGEDIREEFAAWTKNRDHDGSPIGSKKVNMSLCWEKLGIKKYLPPQKKT